MIIFANASAAKVTADALASLRVKLRHKPEFKFSKSTNAMRDAFFRGVSDCPFAVRALTVRKEALQNRHAASGQRGFYQYFVRLLLSQDGGTLQRARVRIDGSGSQKFRRAG